jgi:mannose-6-phosphate isomerase-like protein (cupin superfamily)
MTDLVERFSTESLLLPESGARVMRQRLRTVDVHWHDYYELCLVVSGEAEHVVNGVARPIGRGSAFLLSPADFHAIRATGHEPLGCYNTVIDPRLMERQLAGLGPPSVGDLPWQTDDFLDAEGDLRRLQAEFEEPRLGGARLVEALVGCLVVGLARHQRVEAAVADHRPAWPTNCGPRSATSTGTFASRSRSPTPPGGRICRRTTSARGSGSTPARPSSSTCRNAVCGSPVPCSRRRRCP